MGTKIQCKNFLPGYYSMGNINEDTNSSCEDRTLSGNLYNGFMLKPVNGYSEHGFMLKPVNGYSEDDKEAFKQIMLKHEATFRKQVHELHRLYRIQKDLMDELKTKQLNRFSVQMDASQSNLFSSQMSSEVTERAWQMPYLTTGNTSYNRASAAGTKEMRPPVNFLKENNTYSSPLSSVNGASLKDEELLDSKLTKLPRKMFDLQLPADVYIDNEDTERAGKENVFNLSFRATDPLNTNGVPEPETDVKLTLSSGEDPCCIKGSWKSDSHPKNGPSIHKLADLNEPIKDICCEGEAGLVATQILSVRTHSEGMQGNQLLSNANHLHRDIFTDMYRNEGTCSNFFSADKQEPRQQWLLFDNEVGQSRRDAKSFNPDLCNEKLQMSSIPMQLMHTRAHENVLPDQNKTETWFGDRPNNGLEISGRSPHLANSTFQGLTVPKTPGPFSVVPYSDYASTASSPVSSWRKPMKNVTHIPIAVQALPCFNGSATMNVQSKSSCADIQNLNNSCGKWPYNRDFGLNPTSGSEISSSLNDFHHRFPSNSNSSTHPQHPPSTFRIPNLNNLGDKSAYGDPEGHGKCFKSLKCTDVKPTVDVSLNQALTNGTRGGLAAHQDVEGNHEGLLGGISWLETKAACNGPNGSAVVKKCASQMESGFSQGYSQLKCSHDTVAPEIKKKSDKGKGPSLWALQDYPSSLQVKESRMQGNEVSGSLNGKRILGFPILDKVQQSPIYSPFTNDTSSSAKHGLHSNLSYDVKVPSSEKQVHAVDLVTVKDVGINLNSEVSCMDIPNSSENSPVGAEEVPSPLFVPSVVGKIAREIDLEAPISALAEESIYSQEEIIGMNHLAAPIQMPLNKTDGRQETECSYETLARMAAKILFAMSLDIGSRSDNFTCPLTPASCDSLHWFAEFVSSNAESTRVSKEGGYGGAAESSDDDGLDHFESMTLKLKEMKPEEFWSRPQELENPKDEKGTASLLLTRLRRGQGRKRRQRRDFQKDILPGLASLSRHEVTEDLQAFGGLMRTPGRSLQASLARRNTSRNGFPCQARGRRRPRSLAVTVAEIRVNPTPAQPTLTESELDGRTITGWGRTTRRCRRQRAPSGNASVLLT